ncbi:MULTISPECIES: 4'-phosphopantetheinyl transferase superfamily protein [Nocardiopsis]|uniref:4'-phosphopantetheinyl transferase family protein n=1 Tax=Nocardiopsis TaxID=2013 RepID=UPI0003671F15|nr:MULTISPECIES: 4'-phosphopantetheinyl transferase superfamily protein [Nocardiopsis]APC36316.1 4-phosphopantetheinyl transferase [Nocardiopsis dassonvillei]ASU59245.1 4-phosphopantetheinyl transferase [Nocardiopsis dassonvillei]
MGGMKLDPAPLSIEVWWVRTSAADDRLLRLLDEEERSRNARFRLQADRDRHLLGRAVSRLLLAERADCPPEKVTFALRCRSCEEKERAGASRGEDSAQGPHGKPHPSGPAEGWELSVSHSGEWVVLALAREVPVGVDVERVSPARDLEGLAGYTLGEPEQRAWERLSPADRVGAFFRYWARKEALLKATGLGLSGGMRRVLVSPADAAPALLSWEGGGAPGAVALADLDVGAVPDRGGEEYRSALAVLTDRPLELEPRTHEETVRLLRSRPGGG